MQSSDKPDKFTFRQVGNLLRELFPGGDTVIFRRLLILGQDSEACDRLPGRRMTNLRNFREFTRQMLSFLWTQDVSVIDAPSSGAGRQRSTVAVPTPE